MYRRQSVNVRRRFVVHFYDKKKKKTQYEDSGANTVFIEIYYRCVIDSDVL